jgi:hypothetical protein
MKTIYVCGDSFSATDPEYGPSWTEMIKSLFKGQARVVNLSIVAASNLLVSIQAGAAVSNDADFILVNCTAVTRSELAREPVVLSDSLMDRFDRKELISFSILRPYRSHLTESQCSLIKQYHTEFFDLPLAIYKDSCIIANMLYTLEKSGIPFLFDQGGFEHASFGASKDRYFADYDHRRSAICLWDHATTAAERPYYHITDASVHRAIAEYYYEQIRRTFNRE